MVKCEMKKIKPINHDIFEELEARIGRQHLSKRLRRQVSYSAFRFTGGFKIYWENFYFCHIILKFLLTISGMLRRCGSGSHGLRTVLYRYGW